MLTLIAPLSHEGNPGLDGIADLAHRFRVFPRMCLILVLQIALLKCDAEMDEEHEAGLPHQPSHHPQL